MPRPRKCRRIAEPPAVRGFRPYGCGGGKRRTILLSMEEYEAIRLSDHMGLKQEDAANEMGISRPTFTRLIEAARKKTAEALVTASAILIDGGSVIMDDFWFRCLDCGNSFRKTGRSEEKQVCPDCGSKRTEIINEKRCKENMMMKNKTYGSGEMGSSGLCVCLKCGYEAFHRKGVPCRDERCEKCGAVMVREGSEHHNLYLEKQKKSQKEEK